MTESIGSPPLVCNLPLSTGQDLVVDFECQDGDGNAVDYPDGVSVTLIVELWRLGLVSAPAVMTGSHAVCYVAHQTTDQLDDGTIWRCQVTAPGSLGTPPTIDLVPVNGTTKRYDGAGADSSTPVSIPVVLGPGGDVTVLVPTPGTPGRDGNPGPANTIAIGTVEGGDTAAATLTGSSPTQTLNLVLPAGAPGSKGNPGDTGLTGPAGGVNTVNTRSGDVTLTSSDVGLDSVDNTADVDKPVSTAGQSALDAKEDAANKGAANGYTPLGADSLVPSAYLPSYVDDVLEFANLAAFPGTGETGKIYTAIDTEKIYRWGGSIYVEISPSPGSTDAVPEGSTNLYYTDARADARVVAGITGKVSTSRQVATGTGLTGGGDLSADRTLAADFGTGAGKVTQANDSRLSDTRTPTDGSVTAAKLAVTGTPNGTKFLRDDMTWAAASGGGGSASAGLFSARPSPGTAGSLYFCEDNGVVYRDTGSAWVKVRIGESSCDSMGDVPTSGWTAVNMQTGASFSSDKDAMLFTIPSIGAAANWQYQYRAYPTPPFTLTVYIDATLATVSSSAAWGSCGIVISDGTKLISLGPEYGAAGAGSSAAGWNVWGAKFTNATTFSAVYGAWPVTLFGAMPKWFRFTDNGTNIIWQVLNGIDWITIGSEPRTTFLTPTRIGLGGTNYAANTLLMRARSWNGVA